MCAAVWLSAAQKKSVIMSLITTDKHDNRLRGLLVPACGCPHARRLRRQPTWYAKRAMARGGTSASYCARAARAAHTSRQRRASGAYYLNKRFTHAPRARTLSRWRWAAALLTAIALRAYRRTGKFLRGPYPLWQSRQAWPFISRRVTGDATIMTYCE